MIFKYVFILSVLFYGYSNGLGLYTDVVNLIDSDIQKCLNCLCHAVTGCWRRSKCAQYSITKDYWRTAGLPAMNHNVGVDEAYRTCMGTENCILNTIKRYTESFGDKDCNYDGVFDCKDRAAIHLFGDKCHSPRYGIDFANQFNHCNVEIGVTAMSARE